MFWYLSFIVFSFVVTGLITYFYHKFFCNKSESFIEWCEDRIKMLLKLALCVILIVTILSMKPLYKTLTCQFDGIAANTETSYSWYKGQCLYKSKTGAWLPLGISRDQPEGQSHDY